MSHPNMCTVHAADELFFRANRERRVHFRPATRDEVREMRESGIVADPGSVCATIVARAIDGTVLTFCMLAEPSMLDTDGEEGCLNTFGYFLSLLPPNDAAKIAFRVFGETVGGVH